MDAMSPELPIHRRLRERPTVVGTSDRDDRGPDALQDVERRRIICQAQPDDLTALTEWGSALCRLRRIGQAEEVLLRALQIAPQCPRVLSKLATIRLIQGRSDEAVALVRTALESDSKDSALHSKLIGIMAYTEAADTSSIKREQRAWDRTHVRAAPDVAPREPRQTRKLRIGYLADDLRAGSVSRAFAAVPRHTNRDDFEAFCYSGAPAWDQTSIDLCFHVDAWRTTRHLDDDLLDAQIRRDRIDILVDLCGHMDRNRLKVVARRPAPVQLSGWGYTPGPGIAGIDGLLTSQLVVPANERWLFPEQLLDLPCAQYHQHPGGAPDPGPLPCQVNGFLTLGCLNRVEKIGPGVCKAWADILRVLDRARLVLMDASFGDPAVPTALRDQFTRLGIAPHRVEFLPRRPFHDYLIAHQSIDLALDPWPHSGGLTTFDALWMGVPVVTLRGRHPLGRTSASILECLGLSELVAADVGLLCRAGAHPRAKRRASRRSEGVAAQPDRAILDGRRGGVHRCG